MHLRHSSLVLAALLAIALLSACASQPDGPAADAQAGPAQPDTPTMATTDAGPAATTPGRVPSDYAAVQAPPPTGPPATLSIDVGDAAGRALPSRIDLLQLSTGGRMRLEVPRGTSTAEIPAGSYRAYVKAYDDYVPVLCDVQDFEVAAGETAYLLTTVLEGAAGDMELRDFDVDGDLAISRVELAVGTDPMNAVSVPGRPEFTFPEPVLLDKEGWYAGELFAHSSYGHGTESVAELVRRAEREGLDFLAITDENTLAAAKDPGFQSDEVVLIPAMYWGDPRLGHALIYGPRTVPDPPSTVRSAQAECIRIQAQGGIYAIAHPCFPTAPWQWGLSYVNAVQVWTRPWNAVPPMAREQLRPALLERVDGQLVNSIARASSLTLISANDQASRFYDYELDEGLMASAIGGSGTASPRVPMGRPITWVHAPQKSVAGILEGLRRGHTFVSSGLDGPRLFFQADVGADGKLDIALPGGVIPTRLDTDFWVAVEQGDGKKLQVLQDGLPILTRKIEGDLFATRFRQVPPDGGAVYRVRVVGEPDRSDKLPDFGPLQVFAMSSPIYARNQLTAEAVRRLYPGFSPEEAWIEIAPWSEDDEEEVFKQPEVQGMPGLQSTPGFGRFGS